MSMSDVVYRSIQSKPGLMFDGLVQLPMITITLHNHLSPQRSLPSLTVTLDLYVVGGYPLLKSEKCDWTSFFSTILLLEKHLDTVQIGFPNLKEYGTFYDKMFSPAVKEVLSHLSGVGKLTEGYWNEGAELWSRVSDDRPLGEGPSTIFPLPVQSEILTRSISGAIEFTRHFHGKLTSEEQREMVYERHRLLDMERRR